VRRQVEGWSDRYRAARTPDAPDFEDVMAWLKEKMPPDFKRPALIHNDYKFDNVVLDPANPLKIIGVLDWEMATIGDPLMDLGSSLGYWVQADDPEEVQVAGMLPTNLPGALTRAEMVQRYAEKAGIGIDNFDFYLCFGIFRIVVILQQIYYRFYHGQTKDERFRVLIFGVHIAGKIAQRIIQGSPL
jgi:aminoglycoside phosphotransferase (APT) family kinase protein